MIKLTKKLIVPFLIVLIALCTGCKGHDVSNKVEGRTVLVQLYSDSTRGKLENQFAQYALKEQKKVSRPMNIYLFTFDTAKVSDTTLVRLLKESSLVKEAQTNKEVIIREK